MMKSLHMVTQGIPNEAAEFLSGETNLQFNSDSGLEQLQHVWHAADGDPRTKLAFLGQAVIVGGLGELAQPLQQVAEAGVEKTRKWRWGRSAKYERLQDT